MRINLLERGRTNASVGRKGAKENQVNVAFVKIFFKKFEKLSEAASGTKSKMCVLFFQKGYFFEIFQLIKVT